MFSIMDPRVGDRMGMSGEVETAEVPLVTNGGFKSQLPQEDLLCILPRLLRMQLLLRTLTLRISFQDQAG